MSWMNWRWFHITYDTFSWNLETRITCYNWQWKDDIGLPFLKAFSWTSFLPSPGPETPRSFSAGSQLLKALMRSWAYNTPPSAPDCEALRTGTVSFSLCILRYSNCSKNTWWIHIGRREFYLSFILKAESKFPSVSIVESVCFINSAPLFKGRFKNTSIFISAIWGRRCCCYSHRDANFEVTEQNLKPGMEPGSCVSNQSPLSSALAQSFRSITLYTKDEVFLDVRESLTSANSIITLQHASHYCSLIAVEKMKNRPALLHMALWGEEGREIQSLLPSPSPAWSLPFPRVQPMGQELGVVPESPGLILTVGEVLLLSSLTDNESKDQRSWLMCSRSSTL